MLHISIPLRCQNVAAEEVVNIFIQAFVTSIILPDYFHDVNKEGGIIYYV